MLRLVGIRLPDSRAPKSAVVKYEAALKPEHAIRQNPRLFGIESERRPIKRTKTKERRYGGADRI